MQSDKELVEGCKKQQSYAQMLLYKKYAPEAKAVCLMYIKDKDLAKDIIQDSFIKVFENLHSYRYDGPLMAWIRRIVVNTTLNYIRKSNKEGKVMIKEDLTQLEILEDHEDDMMDELIQDLTGEDIHQGIINLPENFRLVFSLYYLEDYSHKEIADKLNINESLSRVWLNRSKKMLKNILLDVLTKNGINEKGFIKK